MEKKEHFKVLSVVFLVLKRSNEILLLRRYNTPWLKGYYSLVAGHLDGGETAKQAMIREAKEEANIVLKPEDLTVVHVMHRMRSGKEFMDVYLEADMWEGEVENREPERHDNLGWFHVDQLPEPFLPEVKYALENIARGIFYSEFDAFKIIK